MKKMSEKERKEVIKELGSVKDEIKKSQAKLAKGSRWKRPLEDLWQRTLIIEKHLKLKSV